MHTETYLPTRCLAQLAVAICCFTEAIHAAPLFEEIYVEGEVLAGADAIPGFLPIDTVRDNGSRSLVIAPNGNFITSVNTDQTQPNGTGDGTAYHFGSTTQGTSPTRCARRNRCWAATK